MPYKTAKTRIVFFTILVFFIIFRFAAYNNTDILLGGQKMKNDISFFLGTNSGTGFHSLFTTSPNM